MSNQWEVKQLVEPSEKDLEQLSNLLIDVVADGASVGFLPPLGEADARTYWKGVWAPGVTVWSVSLEGTLIGTVQLHEAHSQNGKHRAEIAKLMVHSDCRGRGIARALMNVAEKSARDQGRTLLVLDTRAGDPSNSLYQSLGFIEAGRIPNYARSADGNLDETVFYYKHF
ncbi:GNAT family N-acetyltransferase [Tumebacillus sp. ITR2]|uniref:GNAT family N-acetyltransferase n=1 Tax=Tumebacillus amylolyticus TaxID=2801339 RepID=A0ABS1JDZ8_9BACL|nr:GNAT family N-acetyltransferase [Tumebacillus amylolyticus]MBL0388511.1 GNAT family N-acetyltransferase [Tumebacillus amylolyticus]